MVAWSGVRVSGLSSDLGASLCFILRIWRRLRIRSWVRLNRLASTRSGRLLSSLVGTLGWRLRAFRCLQPWRFCSTARRFAILKRKPGDAQCQLPRRDDGIGQRFWHRAHERSGDDAWPVSECSIQYWTAGRKSEPRKFLGEWTSRSRIHNSERSAESAFLLGSGDEPKRHWSGEQPFDCI